MPTYLSDYRLRKDTFYVTAPQAVFVPTLRTFGASVSVMINGLLQTLPGVYDVADDGTVTLSEPCIPGDWVVLRYTAI